MFTLAQCICFQSSLSTEMTAFDINVWFRDLNELIYKKKQNLAKRKEKGENVLSSMAARSPLLCGA